MALKEWCSLLPEYSIFKRQQSDECESGGDTTLHSSLIAAPVLATNVLTAIYKTDSKRQCCSERPKVTKQLTFPCCLTPSWLPQALCGCDLTVTVVMNVNSQAGGGVERQAGDLLRRLPAHPHQLHHQVNLVTRRLLQRGTAHSAEESESERRHTHTHTRERI